MQSWACEEGEYGTACCRAIKPLAVYIPMSIPGSPATPWLDVIHSAVAKLQTHHPLVLISGDFNRTTRGNTLAASHQYVDYNTTETRTIPQSASAQTKLQTTSEKTFQHAHLGSGLLKAERALKAGFETTAWEKLQESHGEKGRRWWTAPRRIITFVN